MNPTHPNWCPTCGERPLVTHDAERVPSWVVWCNRSPRCVFGPVGEGRTKWEAIQDWVRQLGERTKEGAE